MPEPGDPRPTGSAPSVPVRTRPPKDCGRLPWSRAISCRRWRAPLWWLNTTLRGIPASTWSIRMGL